MEPWALGFGRPKNLEIESSRARREAQRAEEKDEARSCARSAITMEAEDGGPRQPALRPRGGENRIGGRRRPRGRPPTFSRVVSATAVVLVLALALGLRPARAFDVASPIFGAIGNVASYSINKLVIDPERERQVFKVVSPGGHDFSDDWIDDPPLSSPRRHRKENPN